jgi:hypothetical protein
MIMSPPPPITPTGESAYLWGNILARQVRKKVKDSGENHRVCPEHGSLSSTGAGLWMLRGGGRTGHGPRRVHSRVVPEE